MYTNNDLINIDVENRRNSIIEFIKLNQGCSKSRVVIHAKDNGYASKVTVYDILKDLEEKKILISKKDKPNSKSLQLFIKNDNHVLVLRNQLQHLDSLLNSIINPIYKVYIEPVGNWPRIYSIDHSYSQLSEVNHALPFLISFIDHAFKYHYQLKWPKYDSIYRDQLYTIFFTQLGKWYNLVNNKKSELINRYQLQFDYNYTPPKQFEYHSTKASFDMEEEINLYQPLYKIQALEHIFRSNRVLKEYRNLIEYLFDMNIAQIEAVYPELNDMFIFIKMDSSYLEKFRSRLKEKYQNYLRQKGSDV
ncbi:MAG: hypothetical protein AB7U98_10265 [Candidatus Nitrosocosmicus sp.]